MRRVCGYILKHKFAFSSNQKEIRIGITHKLMNWRTMPAFRITLRPHVANNPQLMHILPLTSRPRPDWTWSSGCSWCWNGSLGGGGRWKGPEVLTTRRWWSLSRACLTFSTRRCDLDRVQRREIIVYGSKDFYRPPLNSFFSIVFITILIW